MKVIIRRPASFFGPFQLIDKLFFWLDSDCQHALGEKYADSRLGEIHSRIAEKYYQWQENRTVNVRIDDYDSWNADYTLSCIILPLLKEVKEHKHGAPYVYPEDVPVELRPESNEILNYKTFGEIDDKHFDRWDWVLDEMIWAFNYKYNTEESNLNESVEEMKKNGDRAQIGFKLFGKYFQALWT